MKKPTVTDIKRSGILGEHFFSRDTLRFFDQTMASFSTRWFDKDKGIVCLFALRRDYTGEINGITRRLIQIDNGKLHEMTQ